MWRRLGAGVSDADTSTQWTMVPVDSLHRIVEARLAVDHSRSRVAMTEELAGDIDRNLEA